MSIPPPPATPETARTGATPGPIGLGQAPRKLFQLQLPRPANQKTNIWLVMARVIVHNNDGNAQDAGAQLFVTGTSTPAGSNGTLIDEVSVRIPAVQGNPLAACLSLQAVISRTDTITGISVGNPVAPHNFVNLFASGFNCDARQVSMIAVDLGSVNLPS